MLGIHEYLRIAPCYSLTAYKVSDWSYNIGDPLALTEANTQSFDISSGEVYDLELVAGMIFTVEVQFNWRLRM